VILFLFFYCSSTLMCESASKNWGDDVVCVFVGNICPLGGIVCKQWCLHFERFYCLYRVLQMVSVK